MKNSLAIATLILVPVVAIESNAYAYVDPGLISSLYQALYIAIFGVAMGVVVKPARFFMGLVQKFKSLFSKSQP